MPGTGTPPIIACSAGATRFVTGTPPMARRTVGPSRWARRPELRGPVATIETERAVVHVGTVEVSDDRVSSWVDGTPGPPFRQIEIEAKGPGADPLLADLSDRLIRAGAKTTTAAKLETVLGGRPEPEVVIPQLRRKARVDVLVGDALARSVIRLGCEGLTMRPDA